MFAARFPAPRRLRAAALSALLMLGCGDCSCGSEPAPPASPTAAAPTPQPDAAAPEPAEPEEPPHALELDESPLAKATRQAFGYFETRAMRGDQAWALRQAAGALGGKYESRAAAFELDEALAGLDTAETRMAALGTRVRKPLPPLPVPDDVEASKAGPEMPKARVMKMLAMMQNAIGCTTIDAEARDGLLAQLQPPGEGYMVTHQLWAAIALHDLGCMDGAALAPLRESLARRVLAELLADTAWNDLTAERAALLAYAGLSAWIPPKIIETAISTQRPDGTWKDAELKIAPGVRVPEGHTVALSFYALAHVWLARQSDAK